MLISRFDSNIRKKQGFAWWRMLTWVLLLAAGCAGVLNMRHAQKVWAALQALPAGDEQIPLLHTMLSWDAGYLIGAFVVIVPAAGCILRQSWARAVLRTVALVLCVWLAYRGVQAWHEWTMLVEQVRGAAVTQQSQGFERPLLLQLALQAISIAGLLWLAWQLGQPAVRLQFRPRPG